MYSRTVITVFGRKAHESSKQALPVQRSAETTENQPNTRNRKTNIRRWRYYYFLYYDTYVNFLISKHCDHACPSSIVPNGTPLKVWGLYEGVGKVHDVLCRI